MRMKIKNIISKIALTALIVFAGMSINPLNSFAAMLPSCEEDGMPTTHTYYTTGVTQGNRFGAGDYKEEYGCWNGHKWWGYAGHICPATGQYEAVYSGQKCKCGSYLADPNCGCDTSPTPNPAVGHMGYFVPYSYTSTVTKSGKTYYIGASSAINSKHIKKCSRTNTATSNGCGGKYEPASGTAWTTSKSNAKQYNHHWTTSSMPTGYSSTNGWQRCTDCNLLVQATDTIELTYSNNGGTQTYKDPQTVNAGSSATFTIKHINSVIVNPTPCGKPATIPALNTGYHYPSGADWTASFAYWKYGSTRYDVGTPLTISANRTIEAVWNWAYTSPVANTYTVTYSGNGATSGSTASSSHTYDVAKALTANGFKREYTITYKYNNGNADDSIKVAYSPNGWSWNNNSYKDKDVVKNLTATNGGTVNMSAKWTSKSTTLPTPTKTGYTFDGWYNGSTKVGNAGASYTPTSNVTLTAKWTPITYTVKYDGNGNMGEADLHGRSAKQIVTN